jgi:hypothetical protein
MTTITLPPLPPTDKILKIANDTDGNIEYVHYYNSDTLRARDLEVARLVLEGAEQVADACTAARIRNIEVKHAPPTSS